jgi:hypothetical protein
MPIIVAHFSDIAIKSGFIAGFQAVADFLRFADPAILAGYMAEFFAGTPR